MEYFIMGYYIDHIILYKNINIIIQNIILCTLLQLKIKMTCIKKYQTINYNLFITNIFYENYF